MLPEGLRFTHAATAGGAGRRTRTLRAATRNFCAAQ